jgi:heterodisulfide reductase subunit D
MMEDILKEYYDEMLRCTRCGFCQAACPTFEVLHRESANARGKVQLLTAISQGKLPPSEAISRFLFACLDCRSCLAHCPAAVRTHEIFQIARRAFAHSEFFPGALTEMDRRVDTEHNISGEANSSRLLWQDNLEEESREWVGKAGAEVLFYVGCVASLYPMAYAIPQSMVELMEAAKINFTTLGGTEWCCGYPLHAAGLDIDDLIDHNLAEIQRLGVKTLVATCPSCYYTWTNYYPAGAPANDAGTGALKVMHATQFLADLVDSGRLKLGEVKAKVTYHDPCDLGRKSQEFDAPRRILQAIPGVELVEMANNRMGAVCCGGGGNQESLNPELSAAIADGRLAEAAGTGANILVSACQQCERTLTMAARRAKSRIKVMDVTEILLRSVTAGAQ